MLVLLFSRLSDTALLTGVVKECILAKAGQGLWGREGEKRKFRTLLLSLLSFAKYPLTFEFDAGIFRLDFRRWGLFGRR